MMKTRSFWLLWVAATLALAALLAYLLLRGEDKTVFMPGDMTHGHHQLELACDTCHLSPMGGGEVMQEACVECHGDSRKKPMDSHPRTKFTDPRNADLIEQINVLECITCHQEHQPEITHKGGFTQPVDFCFHCHQDIGEERPTHAGLEFNTCNNSGCHNFHNNRSLYTDFLIKHLDKPWLDAKPTLPEKEFAAILDELMSYPADRFPVQPLTAADADAPPAMMSDTAVADWATSGHARSGVNCSGCHLPVDATTDQDTTDNESADREPADHKTGWQLTVDHQTCASCHQGETEGFLSGLHGMRQKVGLPPMQVSDARLPMHTGAGHKELTCNSCHAAHDYSVQQAAVTACVSCHADEHTLAYENSPHHRLWQQEVAGEIEPGQGVSCASCHMPRVRYDVDEWTTRILVEHNQNATLNPNEKMIRPACLHCHGLEFSIDALADEALIKRNFSGRPEVHLESMDMAREVHERSLEETGGELF